jgi:hypothetical protein
MADTQIVVFRCPPRGGIPQDESLFGDSDINRPDLKLTVNFTELFSPSDSGYRSMEKNSLGVYLALKNITQDVVSLTPVTYLSPGTNLVGIADFIVRQRFKAPRLSTLGLFDVSL